MTGEDPDARPAGGDPWGIAAVALGCIGLVVAGFVLAIVTAVVASVAGARAREQRRSLDNSYLGFGLAVLDGIVFLVLHYLFTLPAFAG